MKKPINKFAVAMWIAAVVVAIVNIAEIYEAVQDMAYAHTFMGTRTWLAVVSGTIAPVAFLVGLGALLEIVDQIRWDAQNRR